MYLKKMIVMFIMFVLMFNIVYARYTKVQDTASFVFGANLITIYEPNPICVEFGLCTTPLLERYKIQVYINTWQDNNNIFAGNNFNMQSNVIYDYNKWIGEQSAFGRIDWENQGVQEKLSLPGNTEYGAPGWFETYTYRNNKNDVCTGDALTAVTSPSIFYQHPEYADTTGCAIWDKDWIQTDYYSYKIPNYLFQGINHINPVNINFGEPPIIIEDCTIICKYAQTDAFGQWRSDSANYYDFIDVFGDRSNNLNVDENYFYDTHRGLSVWQQEQDCGPQPSDGFKSGVKCRLTINDNYRHKSEFDDTVLFSDFFNSGVLNQDAKSLMLHIYMETNDGVEFRFVMEPEILKYPTPTSTDLPGNASGSGNDDDFDVGGGTHNFDTDGDGNPDTDTKIRTATDGTSDGQIISQRAINLEIMAIEKKNSFLAFLLLIVDLTTSIILLATYAVQLVLIGWIFFVIIPGVFGRFTKLLRDLTTLPKK